MHGGSTVLRGKTRMLRAVEPMEQPRLTIIPPGGSAPRVRSDKNSASLLAIIDGITSGGTPFFKIAAAL
jgi:hypothetical protein